MKKGRAKRILPALALFLALLVSLAPSASALVEQSESFYVADYANVLSDSLEQTIVDCNGQLENQCSGAQIVVVTVDYLDGMYADDYAYELFNDWGVGSAEKNNGMLLLLGVREGKAWLAYGLGLDLDSGWADEMLERNFWDAFDRGDYESAVDKLFTALVGWYEQSYHVSLTGAAGNTGMEPAYDTAPAEEEHSLGLISVIGVIVVLLILFSAIRSLFRPLSWFRPRYRRAPPPPPPPYGGPYRRRQPPPPPPYGGTPRRPSAPPRASRPPYRSSSPPRSGLGGSGRGGRPGGSSGGFRPSGRGGGGFSGGGGGRR